MIKSIAIYGASGHGKVVADIARVNGYDNIVYIDDGSNKYISFKDFLKKNLDIPIALGIGDNKIRAKLYQKCIDNTLKIQTLIHPNAIISKHIQIGEGTIIMANVVINVDSIIGKCCIINTSSVIEHDNIIGDFVHISPQVACAGNVKIDNYTHIGIGSCIIQGITIGSNSTIGAGSVVVKNIKSYVLAYGNPCKQIKEIS
jgi:UDP-N-acetylbacillosamine N-acetyltransferase